MTTVHALPGTAHHTSLRQVVARVGLAARGALYVLLGVLAIAVAAGRTSAQANQEGALEQLNGGSFGHLLLWVIAIGLALYALWRFSDAVTDHDGKATKRIAAAGQGIVYGALAVMAFEVALHRTSGSEVSHQQGLTARAMAHSGGRYAVGIVGAVVVIIGVVLVVQGLTRRFERELDGSMSRRARKVVVGLGTFGITARGIVIALSGALVIDAAVTYDPSKASGLDGALKTLRDSPAGPAVLGVIALGVLAFGIYGFAEARWRRV